MTYILFCANICSYTAKGYHESSKGWYIAWSPCNDFDIFVNETVHPWDKACINTGVCNLIAL